MAPQAAIQGRFFRHSHAYEMKAVLQDYGLLEHMHRGSRFYLKSFGTSYTHLGAWRITERPPCCEQVRKIHMQLQVLA